MFRSELLFDLHKEDQKSGNNMGRKHVGFQTKDFLQTFGGLKCNKNIYKVEI